MGLWDWVKRQRAQGNAEILRRLIFPWRSSLEAMTLKNSEVIFAAVNRISTSMGNMPCGLFKDMKPVSGQLHSLVSVSPKGGMTPFEFFRTLEVDRDTEGNGYALKVPSLTGGVAELAIQEPSRVTPMIERESGELWYKVRLSVGDQRDIYVHNLNMIHVRHISTDGIRGINPIDVLRSTVDYGRAITEFSLKNVQKGVHANVVLDFPTEIGETKRAKAIESFLKIYRESDGQMIALDAGVRATRMDASLIDPKILDVDRITRSRVASVYNMPPHLLGDYSASGYASIEQQLLEFMALTMDPLATMYAQELNRVLLSQQQINEGMAFRFDVAKLTMTDSATRSNNAFRNLRSAGATPNEVRRADGRRPYDDPLADELWISKDMVPLRVAAQQAIAPSPPSPEPDPPAPEPAPKGGKGSGKR